MEAGNKTISPLDSPRPAAGRENKKGPDTPSAAKKWRDQKVWGTLLADLRGKWPRVLKTTAQSAVDVVSRRVTLLGVSPKPEVIPSASTSPTESRKMGEPPRDSLLLMQGVLLKKGSRVKKYRRRWFKLVQGSGLFYATHKNAPWSLFHCVPLQGLLITCTEAKWKFVIPPSASAPSGMTLKCLTLNDFVQWRDAIQKENSHHFLTRQDDGIVFDANVGGDDTLFLAATGVEDTPLSLTGAAFDGMPLDPLTSASMRLTVEELVELEDLRSDTPCGCPTMTGIFLESIGERYEPVRSTPGVDEELREHYAAYLPYGLKATLERLRQRFVLPIRDSYESVNRHMVLLDLDVERVRECLGNTLRRYGEEVAVWHAVEEMDYVLRLYRHVREQLLIRLEIAAFREQPNQSGLPLGVNGTIEALDGGLFLDASLATQHDEAVETWKNLFRALRTFRLEFDVFDESEETILLIEATLNRLYNWIQRNTPRQESGRTNLQ